MEDELGDALNAGEGDAAASPLDERPPVVAFVDERLTVEVRYVREDLFQQVVNICRTVLSDLSACTGGMLPPSSSTAVSELERELDRIKNHIAQ